MLGKVEICGVSTSTLRVLKNEETMELLRRAHAGDKKAREELSSLKSYRQSDVAGLKTRVETKPEGKE